jgi:hypothetical protein
VYINAPMKLWNQVCKTDPTATKRIKQRGGFTAIDAYTQIERATEMFGPAGEGWGWTVKDIEYPPNETVAIVIDLWHGDHANSITVIGQTDLMTRPREGTPYADQDALKKALTDAITKGLSYLGFNSDVFLGKFDDNKYVQQRTAEIAAEQDGFEPSKWIDGLRERVKKCSDINQLTAIAGEVSKHRKVAQPADPIGFKALADEFAAKKAVLVEIKQAA